MTVPGMDLSDYDRRGYEPGAGALKRIVWYVCNALLLHSWLLPWSAPKASLLRLFGARVGRGVVIKPRVNIKYPWRLEVGSHVWIGEGVWIDNLSSVRLGDNVCVSQGAYLLTGNHDYRDPRFGLDTRPITIEREVWIGARAIVCPGVTVGRGCVLKAGSVVSQDTEPTWVYGGAPAQKQRARWAAKTSMTPATA